ncbi:MAG: hypothetical protein ACP6IQ_02005 [Candidatus Njordarchaeia archaeon]
MEIIFDDIISSQRKRIHKTLLNKCLSVLPEEVTKTVPKIRFCASLVSAIAGTPLLFKKNIDQLALEYLSRRIWAFSVFPPEKSQASINFIAEPTFYRNKKTISAELAIFHEFGHFYYFYFYNVGLSPKNERVVELMCDRFAIVYISKLLKKYPRYKPPVKTRGANFINRKIRLLHKKYPDKKDYEIADTFIKQEGWDKYYQSKFEIFNTKY